MKWNWKKAAVLLAALALPLCGKAAEKLELEYFDFDPELRFSEQPARDRVCLNGLWQFRPVADGAPRGEVPRDGWQPVRVPSYWNKPEYFEYPAEWAKAHRGWYRHTFPVPAEWHRPGNRVGLYFGAVMAWCQLYVNGVKVPTPEVYGTLPVTVDITPYLTPGETATVELEVQDGGYYEPKVLENIEHTMSYAGIWQDVYLFRYPDLHTGNVHVKTSVRRMNLEVDSVVVNLGAAERNVTVRQTVRDLAGRRLLTLPEKTLTLAAGERRKLSQGAHWPDAKLWDVDAPHLYRLDTELVESGQVTDRKATRFGFREFRVDGSRFLLNEKPVRLRGAWDNVLDPLYPEAMNRRYGAVQFKAMRGMNVNTLRWHSGKNFGLPLFYSLTDETGLMAVAGVERTHNGYPTGRKLTDPKSLPTISRAVLRDRNHPSIVLWSGNNEAFSFIYWEGTLREGPPEFDQLETFEFLTDVDRTVKKFDQTRPLQYHGNYDLFGYADILNVHYPVYVVDLISGNRFFRELRKSTPAIFSRNKPIVVGEFWFVPHLREFSEKYCGDTVFDDPEAAFEACARYHEQLILGWREDRIAGIFSFMTWFPFHHPMKRHISGRPVKLEYDTFAGPYMKPSYTMRPAVNPGWDNSSAEFYPNAIYRAHAFAFQPLVAYLPMAGGNGLAGTEVAKEAVVINDTRDTKRLELRLEVVAGGKVLSAARREIEIAPDAVLRNSLLQKMPEVSARTAAVTRLTLAEGGRTVSQRDYPLTLYPASYAKPPVSAAELQLYDPAGRTAAVLKRAGIRSRRLGDLKAPDPALPLVIGCDAPGDELIAAQAELAAYMEAGGRLLRFEQPGQGGRDCEAFNQAAGHPALDGIPPGKLEWFQGADAYVTAGAFPKPDSGSFRILIDCDVKRTPLVEFFHGKGVEVRCQMSCTDKYGIDPVATRLLHNLLAYIAAPAERPAARPAYLLAGDGATAEALKLAGLGAAPVASVAAAAPGGTLIVGRNGLKTEQVPALRDYAAAGGNVIVFMQDDPATLRKLTGDGVQFASVHTGESPARFLRPVKGDAHTRGMNALDFMEWPLWQTWTLPVKYCAPWRAVVELREGPNAFLHNSLYPPVPGRNPDPYNMIRAEHDRDYALHSQQVRGAAVLAARVGQGELCLIQMAVDKAAQDHPDARRIIAQLLAPYGIAPQAARQAAKRSPDDFLLVDLAPFGRLPFRYTAETGGWSDQGAINDLAEFPLGLNNFAGIPFRVTKCVGLASTSLAKNSRHFDKYPMEVSGIPVGARIAKLHLLLAASYAKPGCEMAAVRLRYEDGSTREFPLTVGRQVNDWWYPKPVPEAEIGWMGKNASCSTLGVYVTAVTNPEPGRKVLSFDLVSRNAEPLPLFAGVSAEKSVKTATAGLNEPVRFRNLEVIPTRIEANGTFSAVFTLKLDGRTVEEGFGCRRGQPRTCRGVTLEITGFEGNRVRLRLTLP